MEREGPGQVALLPVSPGLVLSIDEQDGEVLVVLDDVFHGIELLKQRKCVRMETPFVSSVG